MDIIVNGQNRICDYGNLLELLRGDALDPEVVVVEINGQIIPQDQYGATRLNPGDTLEIVQFVGGG